MNLNITGHHVEITEALKESVLKKLNKLSKRYPDLSTVKAVLTVERNTQKADLKLHYKGVDLSVSGESDDLYVSIKMAASKLDAALSNRKGVLSAGKHDKLSVEIEEELDAVE